MISIKHRGSFKNILRFLKRSENLQVTSILSRYGEIGVGLLASATPKRTGKTASSWVYAIEPYGGGGYAIVWSNTNTNGSANIAILIQYGHGTGTGGYVPPVNYINPALESVFKQMADQIWKEVTSL